MTDQPHPPWANIVVVTATTTVNDIKYSASTHVSTELWRANKEAREHAQALVRAELADGLIKALNPTITVTEPNPDPYAEAIRRSINPFYYSEETQP